MKSSVSDGQRSIELAGVDVDGTPVSFVKVIEVLLDGKVARRIEEYNEKFNLKTDVSLKRLDLRLHFLGHYNEVPLDLSYEFKDTESPTNVLFKMKYNPLIGQWKVSQGEKDTPPSSPKSSTLQCEIPPEKLAALPSKELKEILQAHGVDTSSFFEKQELIDAINANREQGKQVHLSSE